MQKIITIHFCGVRALDLLESIRYDAERMEAKLSDRKDQIEKVLAYLSDK